MYNNYQSKATTKDLEAIMTGNEATVFFEDNKKAIDKIIDELKPAQIGKIQSKRIPPSIKNKIEDMANVYSISHRDGIIFNYFSQKNKDGEVYYDDAGYAIDKIFYNVKFRATEYIIEWAKRQPNTHRPKMTKREINIKFDTALEEDAKKVITTVLENTNKLMEQEGSKIFTSLDSIDESIVENYVSNGAGSEILKGLVKQADLDYNVEIGVFVREGDTYRKEDTEKKRDNKYSKMLQVAKADFIKNHPEYYI